MLTNIWWLYLVRTQSGSLYTGITTDVQRRFAEHQAGGLKAAKSLKGKGPLSLVFSVAVGDRSQALKLEYKVKRLTKAKKEQLILDSSLFSQLFPGVLNLATLKGEINR